MIDTPVISVIMPVYNGERYLRESIQSILRQTLRKFEFVIVDDSSRDSSVSIINSIDDPRIRFFDRPHAGMDEQLNYGISVAKAPLVAFAEQDDISLPSRLEKEYDFMQKNEDVGVLSGSFEIINTHGEQIGRRLLPIADSEIRKHFPVFCPVAFGAAMCRRELLIQTGGFSGTAFPSNDYELWLRLLPNTRFSNLADIVLKKRRHPLASTVLLNDVGKKQRLNLGFAYLRRMQETDGFLRNKYIDDLTKAKLHYYFGEISFARDICFSLIKQKPLDLEPWRYFLPTLLGKRVFQFIRESGMASRLTSLFRKTRTRR